MKNINQLSSLIKVRIILSIALWIAGSAVLLGGTVLHYERGNAWMTVTITGLIVAVGILSSVRKTNSTGKK